MTATHTPRNPHNLPMVIEFTGIQTVRASFPAIPGCEAEATDPNPWRARDEAILSCAKLIVVKLQAETVRDKLGDSSEGV